MSNYGNYSKRSRVGNSNETVEKTKNLLTRKRFQIYSRVNLKMVKITFRRYFLCNREIGSKTRSRKTEEKKNTILSGGFRIFT